MSGELDISTDLSVVKQGESLSGFDKRLLELAAQRLSPQEIAQQLGSGVSAARCAQRIREILRERDWLSQMEQKALIVDDLVRLRGYLSEMMEQDQMQEPYENDFGQTIYPKNDPRWAAEMLKVIKESSRQIELGTDVTDQMSQIRRAHANLMVASLELTFKKFLLDIRETYPEVEEDVMRGFLEDAFPLAVEAIEAKVAQ